MINFEKFTLANGLRVIVHQDTSTPMAVMNIMYDVGSRDENPDKTGFAHLFEHLMFGGSVNISNYDEPLQMAGGETMHILPTISLIIIFKCRQRTWKQRSGLKATGCYHWHSVKKAWMYNVK